MTRIIERLDEIAGGYGALFCDLWGCLHDGIRVFPDAVAALQGFRAGGGRVMLMTNAPRPRGQVAGQLDALGCPRDAWDDIVSSGDTAQVALFAGAVGRRVHHIGPERDLAFFTDRPEGGEVELVPLDAAEGIVCTGLVDDETETAEDYRGQLLHAKQKGLKLLCANPDVVVDRGDKRLYCAGAIAALYEEMGGRSLYYGKPHPPIYDLARQRLGGVAAAEILAVGDGPETDMAGAQGEDLDFLCVTGGSAAAETGTGAEPDPARLSAYLDGLRMSPAYAIGHLR